MKRIVGNSERSQKRILIRPKFGLWALAAIALPVLPMSWSGSAYAEPATRPLLQSRIHYVGDTWVTVQSAGTVGSAGGACELGGCICYISPEPTEDMRTLRISWRPSFEFPGGSKINYLYLAAPMVGAIKGIDTLVSTSFFSLVSFINEFNSFSPIIESSSRTESSHFEARALADQEYRCVYSDTAVGSVGTLTYFLDEIERRLHKPIGLEVTQTSRAWSDGNSNRFVIFDLWIKNISGALLRHPCVGVNIWPSVLSYDRLDAAPGRGLTLGSVDQVLIGADSLTGATDTLNIAWVADNSGDPEPGFTAYSPTAAMGCRILRPNAYFSFNWWSAEPGKGTEGSWGPHKVMNLRDYAAARAFPLGDRSLYQLMTNGEIDYDQMYAAKNFSNFGWAPPPTDVLFARAIASGMKGGFFHLSCGPLQDLAPGDSMPFTYALFVGDKFHTRPDNFARNFDPSDPRLYRDNLDFRSLIQTGRAADWLFDNPGVDTDGDGYAGKFYLEHCMGPEGIGCDTVWYKGDGVPDWGGPKAPPSPLLELTSQPNRVILRWTGTASEMAKDQLSRQRDFEGYRVYSARTNTFGDYALIASWDKPDDFYRLAYEPGSGEWRQISYPLTVDDWKRVTGNPEFDPKDYAHPSLTYGYQDVVSDTVRDASGNVIRINTRDRVSYWAPQGPNHGNTYTDGGEQLDNRIQRTEIRDTVIGEDTLHYGVYEITIDNLNAAIPLWFSVTAFDYGDYKRDVESLEGGTGVNAQYAFPVYSSDVVVDSGLKVTVYPNPYKIAFTDVHGNLTNYFAQGYEGYGLPSMNEHERRIWFANLPDEATIRIYSLDGDLIRELHHPDKHLTRYSSIVGWDLISRNTQAITSGIYIWRVDSKLGSQVGKLVIIK